MSGKLSLFTTGLCTSTPSEGSFTKFDYVKLDKKHLSNLTVVKLWRSLVFSLFAVSFKGSNPWIVTQLMYSLSNCLTHGLIDTSVSLFSTVTHWNSMMMFGQMLCLFLPWGSVVNLLAGLETLPLTRYRATFKQTEFQTTTEGIFSLHLAWALKHSKNLLSPRWRELLAPG